MTPIIHQRKSETVAYVIGNGFPALVQALRSSGPRMMATTLLAQPRRLVSFFIPLLNRRWTRVMIEKYLRGHVSCMQYTCITLMIITLIVFSRFSPPFNPWTFWVRMCHLKGQVSLGLERILESILILLPGKWALPWWTSLGVSGPG